MTNMTELVRRAIETATPEQRAERELVRQFHAMFNETPMIGAWQSPADYADQVRESLETGKIRPGLRLMSMFPPGCEIIVD